MADVIICGVYQTVMSDEQRRSNALNLSLIAHHSLLFYEA
jgi:hypothetical protein